MAPKAKIVEPAVPAKVNKMVAQFLALREHIEKIEQAQKLELEPYRLAKDKLAGLMLQFLDQTGQESARTDKGTVFIKTNHYASLADPDAFMDYVAENGAYELMDRRANSTACRDFAEEHGSLPPGVKINSIRNLNVRSPTQ